MAFASTVFLQIFNLIFYTINGIDANTGSIFGLVEITISNKFLDKFHLSYRQSYL